jgi:uncharacterized protein YihD (DUF1040 family)
MENELTDLTDQELIDKLIELTARLARGRGLDKDYESCKKETLRIQQEIELRKSRKLNPHIH